MPAARSAPVALAAIACGLLGCGAESVSPVDAATTGGSLAVSADAGVALKPADPRSLIAADAAAGWPQFRGPNRIGVAPAADPPVQWDETTNIAWAADVPGRGHGSPVIGDGLVFLATADESSGTQSLLAYAAATGAPLWERRVANGKLPTSGIHPESTHASTTPAVGGGVVFVTFLHDGGVFASAYSVEGERLWGEVRLGDFEPTFGYAASPVLYGPAVIVSADNAGPGFLVALDRETGEVRWRTPRDPQIGFNTPLLATLNGRDTLVICGNGAMDAYDPADGSPLWSVPGLTETISGSAVCGPVTIDGEATDAVLASGGYPGSETLCVRPPDGGEGEPTALWRNSTKAYVPSPLLFDGLAFLTHDDGRTWCYDAATGEEKWKARLPKPNFRASGVAVGGGGTARVYQPSSNGLTAVYAATGDGFEKLAENHLGDECYASPAIVGDRLYLRAATGTGPARQDRLYCIAAE